MSTLSYHLPRYSGISRHPVRGDWWRILVLWVATLILKYLSSALLALCLIMPVRAQAQTVQLKPFQDGEVMRYRVKWSFIRIGTVEISQHQLDQGPSPRFLIRMRVESAKGLPFINLHFVHEAVVSSDPIAVQEETISSSERPDVRTHYRHSLDQHSIIMTDSANGLVTRCDTIEASERCYDAMSLLMFARCHADSRDTAHLRTINNYSTGLTHISFNGTREILDVPAFDESLRSVLFDGTAEWVGSSFAGMSGGFRGWMSDDAASVPLRAEVKIVLGSIVMDLETAERSGWMPATSTFVSR